MRKAARIDNTAKELRAYAESIGFVVLPINGVVDCVLQYGSQQAITDWKSKGGTLTDAQAKLVAKGLRIAFVSTPDQLDALKAELRLRGEVRA